MLSSEQCPNIAEEFKTFEQFAHASLEDIYGKENLEKALHRQVNFMRSAVFLNDGKGVFTTRILPNIAQIAPINAIVPFDVNKDGNKDLICTGNNWGAEVETVRYDAGNGLVLLGDGTGAFSPMSIAESGFFTPGNSRNMELVKTSTGTLMFVSNNQGPLQMFKLRRSDLR